MQAHFSQQWASQKLMFGASEVNDEWLKQKGRSPKYPVAVEEESKLQAQNECVENEMNKDRHHLASSLGSSLPNEAGNPTNVVI